MAVHIYKVTIEPSVDLDVSKKMVMWDAPLRWYFDSDKVMFADCGADFGTLAEQGYALVAAEDKHVRRIPIRADASPEVISRLESIARAEIYFSKAVIVENDMAVKSKVTLVLLKDGKSCDIPQDLRSKLEGYFYKS